VRALTSWTEIAVGLACLGAAWGIRRGARVAVAALAVAGAVAVAHGAVALAA
jgi:hypothetical protein